MPVSPCITELLSCSLENLLQSQTLNGFTDVDIKAPTLCSSRAVTPAQSGLSVLKTKSALHLHGTRFEEMLPSSVQGPALRLAFWILFIFLWAKTNDNEEMVSLHNISQSFTDTQHMHTFISALFVPYLQCNIIFISLVSPVHISIPSCSQCRSLYLGDADDGQTMPDKSPGDAALVAPEKDWQLQGFLEQRASAVTSGGS